MTVPGELMRAEIAEQPSMLRRLLAEDSDPSVVDAIRRRNPAHLQLLARGTSGHAALHAKYLAESLLGIPVIIVTPSVVTMLGGTPWGEDDVVVAVSQSGASLDLVACVESANAAGSLTIAYVNAQDSPLGGAAGIEAPLGAGPELAVAATKSYTASLVALTRLIVALAPDGPGWDWEAVPDAVDGLVRDTAWLSDAVAALAEATSAVVLGRAFGYATAREAALKIMETCSLPTLAYSTAEFRHGPIAAVGSGTVVLATREVEPELLAACGSAGARVIVAPVSSLTPELASIADVVPFQLLALESSLARGLDPDRPTVLAKATLTL